MKIMSCAVENFASYKSLTLFPREEEGLILISGPTGAGKSTICDMLPWCLFGVTAKNGPVDDIRSWGVQSGPTKGSISLTVGNNEITVIRIRGTTKENDLFFTINGGPTTRGKDLKDTQKQINNLVGIDADLFILGSYFNEFSPITTFFTTNAKTRRSITEQLVSLELASSIQELTSVYKKDLKQDLLDKTYEIKTLASDIQRLVDSIDKLKTKSATFRAEQKDKKAKHDAELTSLQSRKDKYLDTAKSQFTNQKHDFELTLSRLQDKYTQPDTLLQKKSALKARILELQAVVCKECGSPKEGNQALVVTKDLYKLESEIDKNEQNLREQAKVSQAIATLSLAYEKSIANIDTVIQLPSEFKAQSNPYIALMNEAQAELTTKNTRKEEFSLDIENTSLLLQDAEELTGVIVKFREMLAKNTVLYLEEKTNNLLSEYFDAEIKIILDGSTQDKIDITILKNGNECSYSQLSKGQRQILRMSFGLSVMQHIENHHGVKFDSIFLDEATDGCDAEVKIKAFRMFESLVGKYNKVFVVEHSSEIKSLYSNKIEVELVNDRSKLIE